MPEDIDKPSYWLTQAANALDKAVQLTGDAHTPLINGMEGFCDSLAKLYKEKSR